MSNAILLHGTCDTDEYFSDTYPSLSNSHWFPWLQKQLLIQHIFTQTPEMPDAYKPDYQKWKNEFEKLSVDQESILVGHSCGGGFLMRWLSENDQQIKKLILVAPWVDPDRRKTTDFFEFTINPDIAERIEEIQMLISDDDEPEIHTSGEIIRKSLPNIAFHSFHNYGHFTFEEMKTEKFPELRDLVLQ